MAESAQYFVERLAEDLYDLHERNLLDSEEVKQVSTRVSTFEYRLQRRISKKQDFLDYIAYMQSLDSLLHLRRTRFGLQDKNLDSDGMCRKKIHQVFTRALKKFRSDLSLWLEYIQFCIKCDSAKVLSRIFAEALMYHPLEAQLWIKAGSWEAEEHSNMPAARTLLQRALRLLPEDRSLWIAYFKLELLYWEKLNKRKQVMLNPQPIAMIEGAEESIEIPELNDERTTQSSLSLSTNLLDTEEILQVIFDQAISLVHDLSFCKQFLQVFGDTGLYPTKTYNYIIQKIQEQFSAAPSEFVVFSLQLEWQTNPSSETFLSVVDKFKDAIQKYNSSELLLQLALFIRGNESFSPEKSAQQLLSDCYRLAEDLKLFDNEISFVEWIEFLVRQKNLEGALKASDYSLENIRSSTKLWELRIRLCLATVEEFTPETVDSLSQLVTKALVDIPSYQSTSIRLLYLQILDQLQSTNECKQLVLSIIAKQAKFFLKDHSTEILDWYLRWNTKEFGIENTRQQYGPLRNNWLYVHSFLETIIEFEKSLTSPDTTVLQDLFQDLLMNVTCEERLGIWIEYLEWLILDTKDFVTASRIYSKAVGTFDKNSEDLYALIVAFNNIKNANI